MPVYTVAQAKNNLPKLLNQALAGEEVTITRRGQPIAQIVASGQKRPHPDGPKSPTDVEWIRRHRVVPKDPNFDSVAMLRAMRDDYRY
ncbi:MAG TPA: type II toxin-antitoxin system prevent-host-death family antitoxin [Caulobacteraceae bacterium]|nr:type II toxin-antitoxin system prevent-host-death family antitoxin [Caulobacteraceae bacterium]